MEPFYIVLSIFLAAMLSYDIAKFVRGDRPDWKEVTCDVSRIYWISGSHADGVSNCVEKTTDKVVFFSFVFLFY
ncbi:hypothetical protein OC195_20555 [Priestia flexa]|nr:hypothetical protein OC195_20555 [Priestia flexa]